MRGRENERQGEGESYLNIIHILSPYLSRETLNTLLSKPSGPSIIDWGREREGGEEGKRERERERGRYMYYIEGKTGLEG